MNLNLQTGRIEQVNWLTSPNYDARPHPYFINTVVIHAISLPPSQFGQKFVEDFFCNTLGEHLHPYFKEISSLKVSTHFYINRLGELMQFVHTHDRAWHAGVSCFQDMEQVNDFSIGIELEGCDDQNFTDAQYVTLHDLSIALIKAYPAITQKRIVGHYDIAPIRKTDPGPCFDWQRYLGNLKTVALDR